MTFSHVIDPADFSSNRMETYLLKHLIEQHPQPRISFYHLSKLFQDRMKLALFLGVRVDLFDGLAEKVVVVTFVLGKPLAGLSGDTGQRREESGGGVSQEGIGSDGTLGGLTRGT